jgi:uncharacterized membrane protein
VFEFFFKYPVTAFTKGTFVLLGSWPKWVLVFAILAAAGTLGWLLWRSHRQAARSVRGLRMAVIWILQSLTLTVLLLLLWEPAISVTALKPQQNIIAVVIDDSRSMGVDDIGRPREHAAIELLNGGIVKALQRRFQVRLYRLGNGVSRIQSLSHVQATDPATQIGKGLRQLADEAATLPIGAVVLLSDGSDNTGGIDLDTMTELQRRRIPVSTIGFGEDRLTHDIEVDDLDVPSKTLPGSRLQAVVTIRQSGFTGKHANLVVTGAGSVLASKDIVLRAGPEQRESIEFNAAKSGVQEIEARVDLLPGETNTRNNQLQRVLSIDTEKKRILYVEGEPRWEFKFIRRAVEDDPALQIVSMLRTTQNKIYRQGIDTANELVDGFPHQPEDLFIYQAIILGSVESAFFTTEQKQSIKDFVDRRGGGLLFLGGRYSLADGGYNVPPFTELLPVILPPRKDTFKRDFVPAELTEAGRTSLLCRIESTAEKSADHWEVLPYLANYQDPGTPKLGATVLARVDAGGNRTPLLITQNYGRGRSAVFATGGSWRWRMQQPLADTSQETFWRQLLRWTAGSTPSPVTVSTPNARVQDDGRIELRAEVRNKAYLPVSDARVEAHVIGPDGSAVTVPLRPDPLAQGIYSVEWSAPQQGSYVAEVSAIRANEKLGSDVLTFRREDGLAENFHREQNRELLQKVAEQTGGQYYTPHNADRLPREIAYSEAGITSREIRDLWDMPAILLLVLALRSTEWLLRRRWGIV